MRDREIYDSTIQFESLDFEKPLSMTNQIYKSLGRAIAKGDLKPGQLLTESGLQRAFGVSRAPIREAIRLLEAEDLVVLDSYKKKYVRPITCQHIKELIPVLACLEGYAAKIAAEQLTDEHIASLEKMNEQIKAAYEQEKNDLIPELNFDFHRIYVKAANNQVLNKAIRSMKKGTMWFWLHSVYYKNIEVIPMTIAEHDMIVQGFMKRDPIEAEVQVRRHIENILDRQFSPRLFDSEGFYISPKEEKIENVSYQTL